MKVRITTVVIVLLFFTGIPASFAQKVTTVAGGPFVPRVVPRSCQRLQSPAPACSQAAPVKNAC